MDREKESKKIKLGKNFQYNITGGFLNLNYFWYVSRFRQKKSEWTHPNSKWSYVFIVQFFWVMVLRISNIKLI